MTALARLQSKDAMATRWRRRRVCTLVTAIETPATLRTLSATRLHLDTDARPTLGEVATLRHPEAGAITGRIDAHEPTGIALRLDGSETAVAFVLAATASDMSRAR